MLSVRLDGDEICMRCHEFLIPNPDRCGDMSCECHQTKLVHFSTSSAECELDSQK